MQRQAYTSGGKFAYEKGFKNFVQHLVLIDYNLMTEIKINDVKLILVKIYGTQAQDRFYVD